VIATRGITPLDGGHHAVERDDDHEKTTRQDDGTRSAIFPERRDAPLEIQNRMHQSRSEPGALVSEIETKQVEAGALTERPVTTEGRKCPNLDERRR
jgi:hypothetical protein